MKTTYTINLPWIGVIIMAAICWVDAIFGGDTSRLILAISVIVLLTGKVTKIQE